MILAAFTLLVGLVAISQVTPPADAYLFYWRLVLAPLVIAVALAVLAMPILESALCLYQEMATFTSAGISGATA